ncbi:MAG: protein kinase [Planctomycetes bacterium]|nr:protein kinase [Planctomycetota bacterium]
MNRAIALVFDETLSRRLPLPLAQLYRRAHNAKTPLERHHAAFYLWEASLKLLGSVAVVEYAARAARDPALDRLLESLARPSTGHWWEIVRRLVPVLADAEGGRGAFAGIRQSLLGPPRDDLPRAAGLDGALCDALEVSRAPRAVVRAGDVYDRLVQYRNRELGHGAAGQRSVEFYERMAPALLSGVAELLRAIEPLAGRRLVFVSEVRRQADGGWLLEMYELLGEAPRRLETVEVKESDAQRLPRPERVYLSAGDGPGVRPGELRSLHPLAAFDPASGEFFFLNARRGKSRCEYLSYSTGRVLESKDLGAEQRGLLAEILGAPVDEARAEAWAARSAAEEAPAPQAPGERPARRIGEFELVSRIGRGGMGVVYRAWQPSLGRQVALKCLFSAGDPKVETRFAREIRALGRVEHPNLVRIFTSGSDGDQWYYAMELIEGADLARVCDRLAGSSASAIGESQWRSAVSSACIEARRAEEKLGSSEGGPAAEAALPAPPPALHYGGTARMDADHVRQVVRVLRQVAAAAHALHEAGIVHRDVKPGNIMLTADGSHAVLMDLGLAQLADDAQGRLTRTRQFVGTLRYASPEQVLSAGALDRRSDVYSLGATMWELLTLSPLFGAREDTPTHELMLRIQSEEPGSVRRRNPRVSGDLDAIVLKCLEKSPARRYASAAELEADLGRWEHGEPVQARPQTLGYLAGKAIRRNRGRLALAGAVLLVLVVFAAVSAARVIQAHRRAEVALFDILTSSGLEASERGEPSEAILRFAAAAAVHHGDPRREEANRVRLRSWTSQAPVPFAAFLEEKGTVRAMEFHPEGNHLLALAAGGGCTLWDLRDEKPLALPGGDRAVSAATWSPKGDWLLIGEAAGALVIHRFPGGEVLHRLAGSPGSLNAVSWSRDGRLLALGNDHARVWDSRERRFLGEAIEHPQPVAWLGFSARGDRLLTASRDNHARLYRVGPDGVSMQPGCTPMPHLVQFNIAGLLHSARPWQPAFIDEGRGILTVTKPTDVTWWDATSGTARRSIAAFERHGGILVDPEERSFALFDSRRVQVWDVCLERPVEPALEPAARILSVDSTPDGSSFLVTTEDQRVLHWAFPARLDYSLYGFRSEPDVAVPHQQPVTSLAPSPCGRFIATAQADGLVRVWRLGSQDAARVRALPPRFWVGPLAVSADLRHVLAGSGLSAYHPATWTRVYALPGFDPVSPALRPGGYLVGEGFMPGAEQVFTLSVPEQVRSARRSESLSRVDIAVSEGPGSIALWRWRDGERLWTVESPSRLTDAASSQRGDRVWARALDGTIRYLETASGRVLERLDAAAPERHFLFAPGGERYAAWERGKSVRLGASSSQGNGSASVLSDVRCRFGLFSPDGRLFCTISDENQARVWEVGSGRPLSQPLEHPGRVADVAFSPDGSKLFTACQDRDGRIWDWRSGKLACQPLSHRSALVSLGFVSGGRWAVTVSRDDGLRVWEPWTGKPILHAATEPSLAAMWWGGMHEALPPYLISAMSLWDLGDLDEPESSATSPEDLRSLAEALSGQTLDASGGARNLSAREWLDAWRAARPRRRELFAFESSPERRQAWHLERAKVLEGSFQWDAALWHLERAGGDARRASRLRSYVRAWRFAPRAEPWAGAETETLDLLDAKALSSILAGASASPLWRSRGPFIDFNLRYPESATLSRGYAIRTVRVAEPRRVRIVAGSDDSLRLWWNQREVYSLPYLGPAVDGYSEVEVDAAAGENSLLVEVGQSGGNWGLFLRLEDAEGRDLHLTDDDRLVEAGGE